MDFLSDLLLAAGAVGAAVYCLVLSRRLRALTALDSGLGSAIAVLSAQVDDLTAVLDRTRAAAAGSMERLQVQTARADEACQRLELLIAALHDLPEAPSTDATARPGGWMGQPAEPSDAPGDTADRGAGPVRSARILRRRSTGVAA